MTFGMLVVFLLALGVAVSDYLDYRTSDEYADSADVSKIVNGQLADINNFPYVVALIKQIPGTYYFFCAGSIISTMWVLSAAQCSEAFETGQVLVNAGSSVWYQPGSVHQTAEYINHPNFQFSTSDGRRKPIANDIMLIKVTTPFQYRAGIRNIKLPPAKTIFLSGTVAGWGMTNAGQISDMLQQTSVHPKHPAICKWRFGFQLPGAMCVAHETNEMKSSPCMADWGSPLQENGFVVGLVSMMENNCQVGAATYYTEVKLFTSWIKTTTGEL